MKSLLSTFAIVLCLLVHLTVQAQWTNTTNINNSNTGSVGIGAAPNTSFKFHVQGAGSTTLAGSLALFSAGSSITPANFYGIAIDRSGGNSLILGINKNSVTGPAGTKLEIPINSPFISSYTGGLSIGRGGNNGLPNYSDITITGGGFVGIGYNNPQALLSVKGTVFCTRLKVTPTSNLTDWPDYVFADDYKLISLDSVESYVKANKHLPDVASAQEVLDNGLDVADNQKAMLQKIEELTLYIIQQQKELKALSDKVVVLENAGKATGR